MIKWDEDFYKKLKEAGFHSQTFCKKTIDILNTVIKDEQPYNFYDIGAGHGVASLMLSAPGNNHKPIFTFMVDPLLTRNYYGEWMGEEIVENFNQFADKNGIDVRYNRVNFVNQLNVNQNGARNVFLVNALNDFVDCATLFKRNLVKEDDVIITHVGMSKLKIWDTKNLSSWINVPFLKNFCKCYVIDEEHAFVVNRVPDRSALDETFERFKEKQDAYKSKLYNFGKEVIKRCSLDNIIKGIFQSITSDVM